MRSIHTNTEHTTRSFTFIQKRAESRVDGTGGLNIYIKLMSKVCQVLANTGTSVVNSVTQTGLNQTVDF